MDSDLIAGSLLLTWRSEEEATILRQDPLDGDLIAVLGDSGG
jgi:hypothetical protein